LRYLAAFSSQPVLSNAGAALTVGPWRYFRINFLSDKIRMAYIVRYEAALTLGEIEE